MNIGIIGFGYMGKWHYHRMVHEKEIEVLSIFDISISSQAEARALGLKIHDTIEDFLNDSMTEAILVATPNSTHFEICKMALLHHKHVICEKPTVLRIEELNILFELANKNGIVFTTHFNRRWDQDFLQVKEILNNMLIGNSLYIKLQRVGQRGILYGWRALGTEGGLLYDWGPHLIDQMLQLNLGAHVTHITAYITSYLTKTTNDFFTIQLKFSNGCVGYIECGIFGLFSVTPWYIYGNKGTLIMDSANNVKVAVTNDDINWDDNIIVEAGKESRLMSQINKELFSVYSWDSVHKDQTEFYRNFVNAANHKCVISISQSDIYRVMKVLELSKISSKINSTVQTDI